MQKNSITNKITPCCGLPFSVIYWWVSNLALNSEADRQFILSKISQNGTLSIDGWKVLVNSGTLEADASLTKAEFLAWFDCGKQPTCEQLKLIIEGYKIGNWDYYKNSIEELNVAWQELEHKLKLKYNNVSEAEAVDIIQRVDEFTGENVNYRETTTWHDGSDINDSKVDGFIYKKIGSKYYINTAWVAGVPISIKLFGAKGDNITNDTDSFINAMNIISSLGGGKILIPKGKYRLKDFTIDKKNIVFVGESQLNSYEVNQSNVSFRPFLGSVFIARLKGGSSSIDAGNSGFIDIMFEGENSVDYGVFIDSGVTIMHRCIVQNCNYGTIIGGAGNSNEFIGNVWNSNTHVGFGISEEDAASFIHPNITNVSPVSTTKIIFKQNKCRQNGFGVVIREGVNIVFKDSIFESNRRAGVYFLRTDTSSVYNIKMLGCWLENNYDWSYQSDWDGYSFDGNRMFLLANNVYQPYEKPKQLGFQMVIDSQTRNNSGGSGSNYDFEVVEFNPVYGSQQKSVKIISAFNASFKKCGFTGDTNDRFSVDEATTHGVYIEELYAVNYNTLFEAGFRGAVILNGASGKRYADKGTSSAPIYFPQLPSNDWRVTDPNILHSYIEGSYDGQISTASGNVFDVTNKIATYTKIGRLIHIEVRGSVTVNQILNYDEVFYVPLPYPAITDQNIIGQVFVKPTGSTVPTSLANNGEAMLFTNTTTTVMSNKPVFKNLEVGQTFDIKYCATYTSSE